MRVNSIAPIFNPKSFVANNMKKNNAQSNKASFSTLPNFYIPTLINFKGNQKDFKSELKEKFLRGDEEELFTFLDKSFGERAKERKIFSVIIDDVTQNAILETLALIREFEENDEDQEQLFDKINEIYIGLKPSKNDYSHDFRVVSLNKKMGKKRESLIDFITEDNIINRLSSVSEDEKEKQKEKVDSALSKADLTGKEREIIDKRYSEDDLVLYREIAKKHGISADRVSQILRRGILKIQISNDVVSDSIKQYIKDFSRALNIDEETAQKLLTKDVRILYKTPVEHKENIQKMVDKFCDNGLTEDNYIKSCIRQPSLFGIPPEKLESNVRGVIEKFKENGLTTDDYIKACTKQPQLFYQSPDTIEKKVKDLVKKFKDNGLTLNDYIKCCTKQPSLFYRSPDNTEKNIKDVAEKYKNNGLTLDNYIQLCVKQPSLFCQSSDTISEHIDILRFCNSNSKEPLSDDDFWNNFLNRYPFDLSNSSSLLLIKRLIIPKMFEGSEIPTKLKRPKQREKLNNYLKNNPDKKYVLNIKNLECDTDCIKILKETLSQITSTAEVDKDTFKVVV